MKKFFKKLVCVSLISLYFIQVDKAQSLIPYYYLPSKKNLEKQSLSIGKNVYQLLYFGQYEDSLNLAKLAVKMNSTDENLWLILSESQVANKLYKDALISLNKAQKLNSKNSEIFFAKSRILFKISKFNNAKTALASGLKLDPNNHKAIFQLGNIFLMEKKYLEAVKLFDRSLEIKPDFWQAINNQALAYFEKNNVNLSIKLFEKAISIENNAEPLLGLASSLRIKDIKLALQLAKEALAKDPNYVNYDYRKEQLWGEKLQTSTEILLQDDQLKEDVLLAESKTNASY